LPLPELHAEEVYNTWQDAVHVQGILRRTSLTDYLRAEPHWQTVLDYDALSREDHEKWVAQGNTCLYPGDRFCLLSLSAGGEDATTLREFDLKQRGFVSGGFSSPRAKQSVAWLDKNTLVLGRDWGPGTMTASGYPSIIKIWKRGQPLDQAVEIYRGSTTDMSIDPVTLNDGDGHEATFIIRSLDFYRTEVFLLQGTRVQLIALPSKTLIKGLLKGQLIISIQENWTPAGTNKTIPQGSVVSLDLAALTRDPAHPQTAVVFAPTAIEFPDDAQVTKNHLIVTSLENVRGRAYTCSFDSLSGWSRQKLAVPDNQTVLIESTTPASDRFFLRLSGFLTPYSLWIGDAQAHTLAPTKSLPAQFDSSRDIVEQLEAVSKDGTKVPYFLVRPKNMNYDGSNPTLLTAYGGFQISSTPRYRAVMGKLWLERGGVYVLANIRGGGEFGPAWHDAGLKTHRQRIYDDFAAVAQDLIDRKITSPRRLGIEGGSNGGLLMGVEMVQHPNMWNAVSIEIPLLDMLRYEHIAAGASWTAEYGSVSVPAEREFLASISPYHQLKPDVNYPECLLFTTTKDDRVGPVHARKFAAKLQEYGKPFFYQEIIEGGHGAGADLKEEAQTEATIFTYFARKLMD
jgi:prolyl oligopeptidase